MEHLYFSFRACLCKTPNSEKVYTWRMFNEARVDEAVWLRMNVYVISTLRQYVCRLALDCPLVNLLGWSVNSELTNFCMMLFSSL